MSRVILIIEGRGTRDLLTAALSPYHSVVEHEPGTALEEAFDLCIIDGPNLGRSTAELEARRSAEHPGILPILLVTRRSDVWGRMPDLWKLVDGSIRTPVSGPELRARVEILLRARRMSLELKRRNDDLEAFIQAMSHDLRASIRAVGMFAEAISRSQAGRLSEAGEQDLERIRWAAREMGELIDSLLKFSRLGREEVHCEALDLRTYIEASLRNVHADLQNRSAGVQVKGKSGTVQADPALLKLALTNLLSNAIKFVPEGVQPKIVVSASFKRHSCRIEVSDNGIGIAREDQQRIFLPFERVYSEERFPGIGLGLPSVRKAVELMVGRVGVESKPGRGSRFWIELAR